ncbi:hypothetical protein JOS77_22975 [Chromobacterium haemolyticum]|nr:hypothetical protein JOS77_22975 [Chromobacterium haemolyticum]
MLVRKTPATEAKDKTQPCSSACCGRSACRSHSSARPPPMTVARIASSAAIEDGGLVAAQIRRDGAVDKAAGPIRILQRFRQGHRAGRRLSAGGQQPAPPAGALLVCLIDIQPATRQALECDHVFSP